MYRLWTAWKNDKMIRAALNKKDVFGVAGAAVFCAAAFILRLYQLFFITDENSGLLTEQYATSYAFYALLFAAGVILLILARLHKFTDDGLALGDFFCRSRLLAAAAYLLAIALFLRFIGLSVMLFDRVGSPVSTDPGFVYPNTAVWMFSLLSSVYYALAGAVFSGRNYDFQRFGLLNLAPVLMSISAMFAELIYSVSAKFDIGAVCRMLCTVLCAAFTISFAASADRFTSKRRRRMYFITLCCSLFCGPCVLSSIIYAIYSRSFALTDLHMLSDLCFGLLAGMMAAHLLKTGKVPPQAAQPPVTAKRTRRRRR